MASYHDIASLLPYLTGWHICVCVLRIYKKTPRVLSSEYGLILCDEKGDRIEAVIPKEFADYYSRYIKQGDWISCFQFAVSKNLDDICATPSSYKIFFLKSTVVQQMLTPRVLISQFTYFGDIVDGRVDTDVLVELVGYMFDVGNLENKEGNGKSIDGFRLSFKMRGVGNYVLNCLATGRDAVDFDRNFKKQNSKSFICVLGWWKIHRFFDGPKNVLICSHGPISTVFPNPEIPEVEDIKMMLSWAMDDEAELS